MTCPRIYLYFCCKDFQETFVIVVNFPISMRLLYLICNQNHCFFSDSCVILIVCRFFATTLVLLFVFCIPGCPRIILPYHMAQIFNFCSVFEESRNVVHLRAIFAIGIRLFHLIATWDHSFLALLRGTCLMTKITRSKISGKNSQI